MADAFIDLLALKGKIGREPSEREGELGTGQLSGTLTLSRRSDSATKVTN